MATDPQAQLRAMIANFPEKTGKSLEAWLEVVRASGLAKHGQIVTHLKKDHGMTHGYANLVSQMALKPAPDTDLVSAQYAGAKEGLRSIYEAVAAAAEALGGDVELSPKKTYVSLRRSKQFGLVQPSTKTRVDLGLVLKGVEPQGRLEASGSFNAMVTHRVRLTSADEVDDAVRAWLEQAYQEA